MNHRISTAIFFIGLCCFASHLRAADANVTMTLNGQPATVGDYKPADVQTLTLSNGLISITFGSDGSATSLIKNGQELIHNLNGDAERDPNRQRSFYIDYNAGRGGLKPDTIRIVKSTPDFAHIAIIDSGSTGDLPLEHHIIVTRGVSGVYGYVILNSGDRQRNINELRTMYRLDRSIFDWAYNDERVVQQMTYAQLRQIPMMQDDTWKLPSGEIYQKYDYSAYFVECPMWGHYGHGFGVFYMPISTEYYGGGPLKQELIIHQDALILNYIQGEHYGAGNLSMPANSAKLFGPWLVYVAAGADNNAVIADAKAAATAEQAKWPYQWMDEPLYPLNRTTVTGQLQVADGRSPAGAWVILGGPQSEIYTQKGGYMFYTHADDSGKFTFQNVRPGTYSLFAFATQGTITQQLQKDGIDVSGPSVDLGTVVWSPPKYNNFLWQIGKSDRMSDEFKYGDQLRNLKWIGMVPADLTFTIGQSKDSDDWYFAQGKVGSWDVNFNLDKTYTGNAHLTVAIAGVSNNPRLSILVNGQNVKDLSYGNDSATYRSALRSARYYLAPIDFPASLLKEGTNTISFKMTAVGKNGGIMYDTIILEAD